MNTLILNRNNQELPDDGWYQIEVSGDHPACKDLIQVIDVDHLSHDLDKATEAKGWLMEVREKDGELEGRIVKWSCKVTETMSLLI